MNRSRRLASASLLLLFLLMARGFPADMPAAERATTDRPDDSPDYQVHLMYVLPSDGRDEQIDTNGTIATSVAAFETWLGSQTQGRHLRLDTYHGVPDITFFRLARTDAEIASSHAYVRDQIERELRAAGFDQPNKIYAVYYGGSSDYACGGGAWPPALPGNVAALYLHGRPPGAPPCDTNPFAPSRELPGYREFSMMHEIMHTLGFVAPCAPHFTLAGHVSDDPRDLMYAGPLPWQPSILDVGHDDYYEHGRPGCPNFALSPFLEPSSWPATRIPLQPEACSEESALRARDAKIPTSVLFINHASDPAKLYWLDYNGHRQLYATLQPGGSLIQQTFLTHPWLVTIAGQCQGIYLPIEQPASVTLQ